MSVLLHTDPSGTQRIRIYCSRKGLQLSCIQEYINLAGLSKEETKQAWAKAERRNKFLQRKYVSDLYSHPWNLRDRLHPGRRANYFIPIRGIALTTQHSSSTRGNVPDWGRSNNYYWFSTYPPAFTVTIFITKKQGRITSRFYFRSNRQLKQAYQEAVHFYLEHKPQYTQFRSEMQKRTPKFTDLKDYLRSDYLLKHGERPW